MGKCGKVCWGVREGEGRCGIGVRKCVWMWGKCGRVYGVSVGSMLGRGGGEERSGKRHDGCGGR